MLSWTMGADRKKAPRSAAGDGRHDAPLADVVTVEVVVLAAVGEERVRLAAATTDSAAYRWDRLEQGQQLGDVVAVETGGQTKDQPAPEADATAGHDTAAQVTNRIDVPERIVEIPHQDAQEESGQKADEGAGAYKGPEGLAVLPAQFLRTRHRGEVGWGRTLSCDHPAGKPGYGSPADARHPVEEEVKHRAYEDRDPEPQQEGMAVPGPAAPALPGYFVLEAGKTG
ncbi:hypothetical protein GCM10010521_43700 [Streptomyces rameus]|uniref:Uncharacterized protein n=1 Tax=Streptomyces rameus TaxID=68261 RepID=A0ABP6NLL1_9ACTN